MMTVQTRSCFKLQDIPLHLSFVKFNHSSHTYVAREAGGPGAGAVATTGRSCL